MFKLFKKFSVFHDCRAQMKISSSFLIFVNTKLLFMLLQWFQCYSWYCEFITSLPEVNTETDFISSCQQCLERLQEKAPPPAWLEYIGMKLTTITDIPFCDSTLVLLKR